MNARSCIVAALIGAATATPAAAQRLSTLLGEAAGLRLTESCAVDDSPAYASIAATPAFRAEMVATANNHVLDPALAHALWMPATGRQTDFHAFENQAILDYVDRFQDVGEIVRAINADASLAARGLAHAFAGGYACFAALPAPGHVRVTEYYSPQLNHYQLAVGDAERGPLASSGWIATGESFSALQQGACYGATNVFRFARSFAASRGSNVLTLDPVECGQVRKKNPAWRPRDVPFFAAAANAGVCQNTNSMLPLYRLYNGREMFNDMNHRYTTSATTYARMMAEGWAGEGVAFCVAGT